MKTPQIIMRGSSDYVSFCRATEKVLTCFLFLLDQLLNFLIPLFTLPSLYTFAASSLAATTFSLWIAALTTSFHYIIWVLFPHTHTEPHLSLALLTVNCPLHLLSNLLNVTVLISFYTCSQDNHHIITESTYLNTCAWNMYYHAQPTSSTEVNNSLTIIIFFRSFKLNLYPPLPYL